MAEKQYNYSLPKDLEKLLNLPPPEQTSLATAPEKELWRALKTFRSLWLFLLRLDPPLRVDSEVNLSTEQFSRLMLTIGATFDYSAIRLLSLNNRSEWGKVTCFSFPTLQDFADRAAKILENAETEKRETLSPEERLQVSSLFLAQEYGSCLMALDILSMPVTWVFPPAIASSFDSQLLNGLLRLADRRGSFESEVDTLVARLLHAGLTRAAAIAEERASAANTKHKPGSFSWMRLQDLGPIAARDETMVRRHGAKGLEAVFEQQLALVFQSFGFLVIPTQRGKRTVDLLCLSNDLPENKLIMVEAKTTKGFYGLPPRDERALAEYVKTVRTSLRTFPAPALLLVVAPRAASTLEAKLNCLSDAVRLPIRFLSADVLAQVRETAPGFIPSDLMLDALLSEGTIISEEFPKKMGARLEELQQVHRRMANDLESVWTTRSH